MRLRKRFAAVTIIPAFAAGMIVAPFAGAQTPVGTPSVDIKPADSSPNDPNGGQWFVWDMANEPGNSKTFRAEIANPAPIDQTVKIYLSDIDFTRDGAVIQQRTGDVSSWGGFEQDRITVPAASRIVVPFTLTPPSDAVPGDHVGAIVAEHEPEGTGDIKTVKRVAVRLYVTVPGDADRDVLIERVEIEKDSTFFPREHTLTITLRNSGRVRLEPTVIVDGETDKPVPGPGLLMSRSVEPYIATKKIPFWGGPINYRIDVTTKAGTVAGPTRQMRVSTFVIPIHLLTLVLFTAALAVLGRWSWSKRGTKYDSIQSDIKRIERLLSMQAAGGAGTPRQQADPEAAIRAALKQARRAGNTDAEAKLQEKLDQVTGAKSGGSGALEAILRELADAPPSQRKSLVRAARAFGPAALQKQSELVNGLPQEVQIKLTAQKPSDQTQKPPRKKRSERP